MTRVLVVDDDPVIRLAVSTVLEAQGDTTTAHACVHDAMAHLGETVHRYDLAVLDHDLPDGTGREVATVLRVLQPQARVVMHTSRRLDPAPPFVDALVHKSAGLGALLDSLVP